MIEIEVRKMHTQEAQVIELNKCLKKLKKIMEKEGIIRNLYDRKYYTKPSQRKHDEQRKKARRTKRGK